jgi:hypothetical protein
MQNRQAHNTISLTTLPLLLLISTIYFIVLFFVLSGSSILAVNFWGVTGQIIFFGFLLFSVMTTQLLKFFIQSHLGTSKSAKVYMWVIILVGAVIAGSLYLLLNIEGFLKSFIK